MSPDRHAGRQVFRGLTKGLLGHVFGPDAQRKSDLLKKLADAEEKHDFYTTLYRQYSINLLKLVIYVRTLVTNDHVAAFLRESHPDILVTFQEIVTNAEG